MRDLNNYSKNDCIKGFLFIDNDKLGEVNFKIIDESMGAIGGILIPSEKYEIYKFRIQKHCDNKGISNFDNFNFRIVLSNNKELSPEGGIGITDIKDFDEIYVESAGIDYKTIQEINNDNL